MTRSFRYRAKEFHRKPVAQLYVLRNLEQKCESLLKNLPTHPARILGQTRWKTLTLELLQSSCDLKCRCKCHHSQQLYHHWLWAGLFVCLLNGYRAKPISSLDCNIKGCHSHSSKITFAFPIWYWYRALSFSTGVTYQPGPERCLTVMRVRPSDAEISRAAYRDALQILASRKASALDVDPAGLTALLVSFEQIILCNRLKFISVRL